MLVVQRKEFKPTLGSARKLPMMMGNRSDVGGLCGPTNSFRIRPTESL